MCGETWEGWQGGRGKVGGAGDVMWPWRGWESWLCRGVHAREGEVSGIRQLRTGGQEAGSQRQWVWSGFEVVSGHWSGVWGVDGEVRKDERDSGEWGWVEGVKGGGCRG